MADDQNAVKHVVWGEVFSFPQVFKSFKMAVQPSKLIIAALGIFLFFAGGMVLDMISFDGGVAPGEICARAMTSEESYKAGLKRWEKGRLQRATRMYVDTRNDLRSLRNFQSFATMHQYAKKAFGEINTSDALVQSRKGSDYDTLNLSTVYADAEKNNPDWDDMLDKADEEFEKETNFIEVVLGGVEEKAEKMIKNDGSLNPEQREEAFDELEEDIASLNRAVSLRRKQYEDAKLQVEGAGVFESFISYQQDCLYNAIMAARRLNFTGGLAEYEGFINTKAGAPINTTVASGLPDSFSRFTAQNESRGVVYYMLMGYEGFCWLISEHWIYAPIFLVWMMILWAFLGGAVYRICALHFAREEKISAVAALKFSGQKFLSFFCAPLIPIALIVVLGLILSLGGLIASIPAVGSLLLGIFFGLAIIIGVGIAFMTIGLVAGAPLMYPTIAVEGSDSFDAISRSFSYIFARPFRAILYGIVAAVYGAITYLFVRLFAFVTLAAVHYFVNLGVFGGGSSLGKNATALDVLWAKPTFWNLHQMNTHAASGWEWFCGILVAIWVYIVVLLVAAYIVTYFASCSTAIYYILRRRVDATDLDDVFVENEDEVVDGDAEETPAEETSESTADSDEEKTE
ncbi:MAG: hypothetical protein KAR11_03720 [Phycisphaerae bacterium]|nr:hypothetical protein [Phycisphaerae bacterium]